MNEAGSIDSLLVWLTYEDSEHDSWEQLSSHILNWSRILAVFVRHFHSVSVFHEFVIWTGRIVGRCLFIEKRTRQINQMEQIIDHNDSCLFLMQVIVLVLTCLISLAAMSMTAVNSSFPYTFEDELALSKRNFTSNYWVVFFELTNDLILLLWGKLCQLLKHFALVLLGEALLLSSPSTLGGLGSWVGAETSHRHVVEVAHVVLGTGVSQHIDWLLLYMSGFVMRDVLTGHEIIIGPNAFLGEEVDMWPQS